MSVAPAVHGADPIVALATPAGRGAVAVVRLSGAGAFDIAARHVAPWPLAPRSASLCAIRDGRGELLDRALVTAYPAPRSFTGDDTIEIATHGGTLVPTMVMAALVRSGARVADPGEFTRRAVLNGKLDLVQAEAIGDLIDAGSNAMRRAALVQLDGGLSRRIEALREEIIGLEALIAYDIDFPEEDDGPIPRERVRAATASVLASLDSLLATAHAGEITRDGALVVIAGAPNAGKSSLFNALLGSARAIVTEIPGTTRDAIEATIDTGAWPVRLVDTAGLRETSDTVERIGIEVSTRYLAAADAVLACGDTDADVDATTSAVAALTSAPILRVRTKRDLGATRQDDGRIAVSAVTGEGLDELVRAIDRAIGATISSQDGGLALDAPLLTRERQRAAVNAAREEVTAFRDAWETLDVPATVAAVHLRAAADALADLIGAIDVEDVLDRLFRTFCVGK
jgi:tRNA modification GTPase